MSELNKARQFLIDGYIKSLQEDKIPWIKSWESNYLPKIQYNAKNNKHYQGINQLILNYFSEKNGFSDPRWCTFKQAKDNGWKIKQGSHGAPIEFWSIYDKEQKKNITPEEYNNLKRENPNIKDTRFSWVARVYTVFNGEQIDGIKPYPKQEDTRLNIPASQYIQNVIDNMNVKYEETGIEAYYSPVMDKVVIPPSKYFEDEYGYYATQLHELCHATGHPSRLNRDLLNNFGTQKYAKEELRAEIASSFAMQDLNLAHDQYHFDNHKAYIQSWISILKNEPNELFKAIKDAQGIADYVTSLSKAETLELDKEINSSEIPLKKGVKDRIANAKKIKTKNQAINKKELKPVIKR